MDSLRVILLVLGVVFIAGIYWWETRARRRRAGDIDDLDTSYLDALSQKRNRKDFGYMRSSRGDLEEVSDEPEIRSAPRKAVQEDLPFMDPAQDPAQPAHRGAESAHSPWDAVRQTASEVSPDKESPRRSSTWQDPVEGATLDGMDFIVPRIDDDPALDEQIQQFDSFSPSKPRLNGADQNVESIVVALTLMAKPGGVFAGDALLEAFGALDIEFGDMDVFHHYDSRGPERREVFCTIANVLHPGTFDPRTMSEFSTPGLALFTQVFGDGSGNEKLDKVLALGHALATALDGDLRDETRSTLTRQSINHIRERIAELSRRQRLRRSEH